MRLRLTSVAIAFAVVACAQGGFAPSALPQQLPAVPWTYVSPLGDTVAGRLAIAIDTVVPRIVHAVHVDTVPGPAVHDTLYCTPAGACSRTKPPVVLGDSTVKDTVVKPVRGVPFGSSHYPASLFGKGTYTATVLTTSSGMAGELARIKAAGARVILGVSRSKSIANGVLSVAAVKAHIATWPDLNPYLGNIDGVMVSDDITGKDIWGPGVPYYAQIDSISLLVKSSWTYTVDSAGKKVTRTKPAYRIPTYVRARPTELEKYKGWKWIDGGWSQYSARYGDVNAYRDGELASAKRQGLCNIFGLNVINGGDGSSKVPGSVAGKYQMSGAEVLRYVSALLPYTPFFGWWEYRPAFDTLPGIKPAIKQVRQWADSLPRQVCQAR